LDRIHHPILSNYLKTFNFRLTNNILPLQAKYKQNVPSLNPLSLKYISVHHFRPVAPPLKVGALEWVVDKQIKKNKADRTYLKSKKVLSSFVSFYVDQSFTAKFVQADVLVTTHRQRESKEYQLWIYSPVNLWIISIRKKNDRKRNPP